VPRQNRRLLGTPLNAGLRNRHTPRRYRSRLPLTSIGPQTTLVYFGAGHVRVGPQTAIAKYKAASPPGLSPNSQTGSRHRGCGAETWTGIIVL
jgi:hypothetical protein